MLLGFPAFPRPFTTNPLQVVHYDLFRAVQGRLSVPEALYTSRSSNYHNWIHAVSVVHAATKLIASVGIARRDERESVDDFLLACLMHDARHSQGESPDSTNIQRAKEAVRTLNLGLSDKRLEFIDSLIDVTEFDRDKKCFVREPSDAFTSIIRDADLLGFMYPTWPKQLAGLFRELGLGGEVKDAIPVEQRLNEALDLLKQNAEFINTCTFYTLLGSQCASMYVHAVKRLSNYLGDRNA